MNGTPAARGRLALLGVVALAAMSLVTPPAPSIAAGALKCPAGSPGAAGLILPAPAHSAAAVTALADDLAPVAASAGMSAAELRRELAADPSLWVDRCGSLFYVEAAPATTAESSPEVVDPGPEQALNLHSRPGSNRTLLLDFDGHYISGTAWNSGYGLSAWNAPAFSTDDDPATFSLAERLIIVEAWARVADDYAAFDVDVTTADPGPAALARTSSQDLQFGTRALISPDARIASSCGGCGGVAYVDVFDSVGGSVYSPAWVLPDRLGQNPRNIAEATSHEVGHNFGLYHDGATRDGTTSEYYTGSGGWAPIMGVGYYQQVTQWSKGEYPGATRSQDDTAVIAAGGAPWVADDLPNTATAALPLTDSLSTTGVITGRADIDWVSFTGAGTVTVTATPLAASPNLDLRLTLATPDGVVLADSAPPFDTETWPECMGANLTTTLPARGTYSIGVAGVGNGLPGTDGATDYGSMGQYKLTISLPSPEIQAPSIRPLTVGAPFAVELLAAGGTPGYTWSVGSGQLPAGLELVANRIVGAARASGSSTATVTVTDAAGRTDSQQLQFVIAEAPRLAGPASAQLIVGQRVDLALSSAGGVTPYTWSLSGQLPPGLTLATGQITGTPQAPGTYQASVWLTDANGATARSDIYLGVAQPPSTQSPSPQPPSSQAPSSQPPSPAPQAGSPRQDPVPVRSQPPAPIPSPAATPRTSSRRIAALSAPRLVKLPTARRKQSYEVTLGAEGGTPPLVFGLVAGKLPKGLALTGTGQLAGTPRRRGSFRFTVLVSDPTGATASTAYRIKVR